MKTSTRSLPSRRLALVLSSLMGMTATGVVFSSGCGEQSAPAEASNVWTQGTLDQALTKGALPRAIIVLNDDVVLPADLRASGSLGREEGAKSATARAAAYGRAKDELLAQVPGLEVVYRYDYLPMLAVVVHSDEATKTLFSRRDVLRVHREEFLTHDLAQSLPQINQPVAQTRGYTGTGTAVAVLDTGVDYTRSAFGSCTAANTPSSCKVTYAADFAPDDGQKDADGHGTNVAGIVLGVAPNTRILALDVFNGASASSLDIINAINWVVTNQTTYNISAINMSLGTSNAYATTCDAQSVFESAIRTARNAGVLSAVASGNSAYTNLIANPACVSTAVSVGAVYDANVGGLSYSNCTDMTTAVDKVTCFSNSNSLLTMLAPGAIITAAGYSMTGTSQATPHVAGAIAVLRSAFPSNTTTETVDRLTGGGLLVTDQRNGIVKPRLDLDPSTKTCLHALSPRSQSVSATGGTYTITLDDTSPTGCAWTVTSNSPWITLTSTGSGTGDTTVTYTVPANTSGSRTGSLTISGQTFTVTQSADNVPPTGSVSIAGGTIIGGTRFTGTQAVTLNLSATDASGVTQMCVSNGTTCSAWEAYATTKNWTLTSGTGVKTVSVWYRDTYNNTMASPTTDAITLDATAPTAVTLTATPAAAQVSLTWTAASDANSGLAGYKVVFGTALPASCSAGTLVYSGGGTSYVHSGLTDGTTYYYRVCAFDQVGNLAAGTTTSARPAPEFNAPVGTVTVNVPAFGGVKYTGSYTVPLALAATDVSGVAQMCLSNTTTCTTWENFATTRTWTLTSTAGLKTVYVWFRDIYGNASTTPVTDTVTADLTAPVNLTSATATGSGGQVDLSWAATTDAGAGMGGYKVAYLLGTVAPSNCNGSLIYSGAATSFTHTGLTNGSTYAYRICPYDNVNNTAVGVTATARPAPEYNPPTGLSVAVNGTVTVGATRFIGTTTVTLSMAATDASGVQMCVSNSSTCTAWETFAATKSWTLASATGAKTVYVFFRDIYNNIAAAPATDTVTLDQTLPSNLASVTAVGSAQTVDLTWAAATDANSGIGGYKIVFSTTSAPANCTTGTVAYNGPATAFTHTGLTDGTVYYYRVCPYDKVGNMAAGATTSARPAPEYNAPTAGTVVINNTVSVNSNRFIGVPATTLSISAMDMSMIQMCVSNTNTCTAWEALAATKNWSLASGTGSKTVYVFFRDVYNNVATAPATDTVTLDQTLPGNVASVSATGGNAKVDLAWPAAVDANSGIGGYKVVFATGTTAPANCTTGTVAYSGPATTFSHTGLTNGTTYAYRVCAYDSVNNMAAGVTASAKPAPEYNAPTGGTVSVNGTFTSGGQRYIGVANVTLALSATDASPMQMCVSNTTTCTAWETFAATKSWSLPAGTGVKTVYVYYRDIYLNAATAPVTDTVNLDQTLPSEVTGLAVAGSGSQTVLTWNASTDANSGVGGYKVVVSTASSPANCNTGTVLYSGAQPTYTHTGLTNGANYYYRVCAYDNVNNMTAGAITTGHPAPEYDPPTGGTVSVNGAVTVGATAYVGTTSVTLNISAMDANAMQMCVSNTSTCTAWETFAATKTWSLSAGTGAKTVYVFLRDIYGNTATTPATTAITLDQTLPTEATGLTATGSAASVTLNWTASTDAHSGIGGYKIVFSTTSAPSNCTSGTVAYSGPATTFTHTGLTNGIPYYYRLCSYDRVNNISAGVTTSAKPAPEYNAPTAGAVFINNTVTVGPTRYIATPTTTLSISAMDQSMIQMCVSNTSTCTAWEALATTKSWSLVSGTGVKTVYVFFRDVYNNVATAPATDSVTLDQALPSEATGLTATGSAATVTFNWTAATDAHSGVGGYKIVYSTASAPANCASGTVAYTGAASTFAHTGLTNGTTYFYRLCTFDNVNNMSSGVTTSAKPAPEYNAPTGGTVSVNGTVTNGASRYIGVTAVTLAISATDASAMQMCVSATTTCTAWETYNTTKSWTLAGGTGSKTVYVFFRDVYNNVAATPASDTVILDQTLPSEASGLTATGSAAAVALNWTSATDAHSGVGGYKIVYATTSAPTNCASGTLAYNGPATTFTHQPLVDGTTYYYRICAYDQVGNITAGVTSSARPAPEYNPPTAGTVVVNNTVTVGANRYLGTPNTTLAISAMDQSMMQMCVSNTSTCTAWENLVATKSWALTAGTGTKTVYVFFRDVYNNVATAPATDTVVLDQTLPSEASGLTATGSAATVTLNWTAATDAHSGVGNYKIVYSTTSAPSNCSSGTVAYTGAATSFAHTGLTNGTTYYYRLCALDNVNNSSAGITTSARPAPEYDPPTGGSVSVNNAVTVGATRYVGVTAVTLAISASDASAMQMCVSANTTCTTWENYSATKSWTLAGGTGVKAVYVFFRDVYNNVAAAPASDTVTLDQALPSDVSGLTATGDAGTANLSWNAATDALSGIGGYKVVFSTTSAPANCTSGTVAYNGPAATFSHTGLTDGTTYYYRVCAVDNVGNTSAGLTTSARPAPEYDPPTGSVSVSGTTTISGTKYIGTTAVTLALTATDASAVRMCVSNTTTCSAWENFTGAKLWTLASGPGTRTVYVFLKDIYNNVAAAPVTDTVILDQAAPSDGILTATPGVAQIDLSWTAAADTSSGLASYKLVFGTTLPTSCTAGTLLYSGSGTSFSHTGLSAGTRYYRVCAIDNVGNVSVGATASATAAP